MKRMVTALAILAGGIFIGIHIFWYIRPSEITTLPQLDQKLTDGQPTVVEFYSNL